jgi:hypothetical protein
MSQEALGTGGMARSGSAGSLLLSRTEVSHRLSRRSVIRRYASFRGTYFR